MVNEFIKLFTGYEGDFGIADMSKTSLDTSKNKIKPNYEWAGRPVSSIDYKNHLEGKISIGIQPCRLNKTVQFGCIDIDPPDYGEFKVEEYLALFQQYKLPLIPILSKSGGLHCYLFLKEPIPTIDLIGKDAIVLKDGKQVTEFKEGILPWSIQNPVALVFDEYDAGRPDVMCVIQRILESEGSFTLLDKNKVISQHDCFRMFATTNTIGLGDTTGLYHGTQQINQGQMDRWNIVSTLNYLPFDKELEIVLTKNKSYNSKEGKEKISNMIKVADLTRKGFVNGDISTVMSPRTVLHWAENTNIFKDQGYAFRLTFLNKCDETEKNIISEYYQRCFGEDLPESSVNVTIS